MSQFKEGPRWLWTAKMEDIGLKSLATWSKKLFVLTLPLNPDIYLSDGEIYSGAELTSWTFQWDWTL